jgi:hypothetical protein
LCFLVGNTTLYLSVCIYNTRRTRDIVD